MPDSVRTKAIFHLLTDGDLITKINELHSALQADKFAYDDEFLKGETTEKIPRVANLGFYIEEAAKAIGLNFNSDGSLRTIRPKGVVKPGEPIPSGWIGGQFARNQGGNTDPKKGQVGGFPNEDRLGIVYEVKSNNILNDPFTGEPKEIEEGGWLLCENWPQYLDALADDLDKALDWQDLGSFAVPSPDKDKFQTYEGLGPLIIDIAYMLAELSKSVKQSHCLSLESRKMLSEMMAIYGLPIKLKSVPLPKNDPSDQNEPEKAVVYPGFEEAVPRIYELYVNLLNNIAFNNAKNFSIDDNDELFSDLGGN